MKNDSRILVLGGRGLVGSSIVRELRRKNYCNVFSPNRKELDLLKQAEVENFFKEKKPEYVIMAAAKVGGIHANNVYRADFILDNLTIQNNVFKSALTFEVGKLLFLGSSCIYPRNCPQPISEDYLLTGPLEQTNEPYAIAKIAGIKLAENLRRQYGKNFFSVMPTNLYGENDNFHPKNAHVIPSLIQRMDKVIKDEIEIIFDIKTKKEFLHLN